MDTVLLMFTRRMEACVAPTRYRQVNYQGGRGDTKEGTIKEDTETLKERGACRGEGPTRAMYTVLHPTLLHGCCQCQCLLHRLPSASFLILTFHAFSAKFGIPLNTRVFPARRGESLVVAVG